MTYRNSLHSLAFSLGMILIATLGAACEQKKFITEEGCRTDAQCGGALPFCKVATHQCIECVSDAHCGGATPACNSAGDCVTCQESGGTGPGCKATLTSLSVTADGSNLLPTFNPLVESYNVSVPLWSQSYTLSGTVTSNESATILWNVWDTTPLAWNGSAQSPTMFWFTNRTQIQVNNADVTRTRASSHYDLQFQRGTFSTVSGSAASQFGLQSDFEGDRLAVAAPAEDGGRGAVFTYRKVAGSWVFEQKVQASAGVIGTTDGFASDVGISGDVLAVGAPNYGCGPGSGSCIYNQAGAVVLFHFENNTWTFKQVLQAANKFAGDAFGRSVALDGPVLAVGAPLEHSGDTNCWDTITKHSGGLNSLNPIVASGAAYVFGVEVSTGVASGGECIKPLSHSASEVKAFGASVDVTREGRLVVGYPGINSAYIYTWSQSGWGNRANEVWLGCNISANAPTKVNALGSSVAVDGSRVVIGAYNSDNAGAPSSGAVCVYDDAYNGNAPVFILPSDAANRMWFGASVGLENDKLVVSSLRRDGASFHGQFSMYKRVQLGIWEEIGRAEPAGQSASVWSPAVTLDAGHIGISMLSLTNGASTAHVYE